MWNKPSDVILRKKSWAAVVIDSKISKNIRDKGAQHTFNWDKKYQEEHGSNKALLPLEECASGVGDTNTPFINFSVGDISHIYDNILL